MEIYEYTEDYRRLIFSLDGSIVQNPTARPIWFTANDQLFCVEAGETRKLK
jgi:hypothetical protein